jgi:hypothetical protein
MIQYKCGHKTSGTIILDSNLLSTAAYIDWAEDNLFTQDLCFDCYLKKISKRIEK